MMKVADEQVSNDEQLALDASVPADAGLSLYEARAAQVYQIYWVQFRRRFKWLDAKFFKPGLKRALKADAQALVGSAAKARAWRSDQDSNT